MAEDIKPFNAQNLEAICKVLADTENDLKRTQIGCILQDCKVEDIDPIFNKMEASISCNGTQTESTKNRQFLNNVYQ